MKTSLIFSRSMFLAALALAGCATVNTVSPAYPQGVTTKVADKRIITDGNLNRIGYVVEVDKGVTDGGLPVVQVQLQNMTVAVKNVDYKFEWFDAQGIQVNDPVTKTVVIEGGETRAIKDVATSPKDVDWKLVLAEDTGRTPLHP